LNKALLAKVLIQHDTPVQVKFQQGHCWLTRKTSDHNFSCTTPNVPHHNERRPSF